MRAGQTLGKIGEYDYRGFAMTWSDARDRAALPLGLAERARALKPIKTGEALTYENCAPDDSLVVTQIRRVSTSRTRASSPRRRPVERAPRREYRPLSARPGDDVVQREVWLRWMTEGASALDHAVANRPAVYDRLSVGQDA